ncbi:uncharacterized protein DEA37_0012831 [Paragonimus westermani]|uniref:BPTI/Kunitz inhibitor domain-containing protein n=1 Tax=Paragonimus westermani TaxID=34504 RepID=A0A5J4NQV4_9TREM|nr:uncharacterized protein DEA37_0000365 [Paragonimus westermani]KAA3677540.1 uncharacterized protein DEA37_0012831 [Paragonimus westermani]
MPINAGMCHSNFLVYAYDVDKQKCVYFIYTGCGGNGNRFRNKVECKRFCKPPVLG